MSRKAVLKQILRMVSSGDIPRDIYDKYLSKAPIGFMSYKDLLSYFDLNEDKEN